MSDCIFCKIANGEIPSRTVYEDDFSRVILDMSPAAKGHALVLPKEHYENIYELPENKCAKAFTTAAKLAKEMSGILKSDGFNIVQNNGETAGQTVFHFHIHLIPRYRDDNQKIGWTPTKPTDEELDAVLKELTDHNICSKST